MELKLIMKSARSAVIEISDGGIYYTREKYKILVNDEYVKDAETVITSVFDLKPETKYEITLVKEDGTVLDKVKFTTEYEFVTLKCKRFRREGRRCPG